MSVKSFKFVSPGVFVKEIDNSQLPSEAPEAGPVIIGRAPSGPALRPYTVQSFSEFVTVFGNPVPGGQGGDIWRDGNYSSPMYGQYAAQAYLANSNNLTYVRLLGAEDPNRTDPGKAGWQLGANASTASSGIGAFGLFLFESKSLADDGAANTQGFGTGSLSAIFYGNTSTTIRLSGTLPKNNAQADAAGTYPGIIATAIRDVASSGTNLLVDQTSQAKQFKMLINSPKADVASEIVTFNFNKNSSKYIRKVFNTNPQLTNTGITDTTVAYNYFLGETFDRFMNGNVTSAGTFAALIPLYNATDTAGGSDFLAPLQGAETPQVIGCDLVQRAAQDPPATNAYDADVDPQKLFKFVALGEPGDWSNKNIKISISDIRVSTNRDTDYGTFSVEVRWLGDSDNVVQILERFDDCNLDPSSLNYVARKIGDTFMTWNTTERRYIESGDWESRSKLIRIVMNSDVDAGLTNAKLLPFGFQGMLKQVDVTDTMNLADVVEPSWCTVSTDAISPSVGLTEVTSPFLSGTLVKCRGGRLDRDALRGTLLFPAPELRLTASEGNLSNPTDAYFGFQTAQTAGSTVFDRSTIDLLRPRGGMITSMFAGAVTGVSEQSMVFTLDDLSASADGSVVAWVSGSHKAGDSMTVVSGAISGCLASGYDRFTIPMYGGYDGTNALEMDTFNNTDLEDKSEATWSPYYSIKRAMDSIADPEVVEMNLASVPGLTNEGLTTHLLSICEERADALAVVDLKGGYKARAEGTSADRRATTAVKTTIDNLEARALNSSYGCAFFPWVRARDTINGANVWLPPSVAAIGTFSSSQEKSQVWFAPAGFNRGGLTQGAAGIPISNVSQRLTRKQRDDLYAANVNPIAKFPAEGIVVFGQKTLQVTPSALDRINVRRLLIFVKKRISQMATTILFQPNVQATWDEFTSVVVPFLEGVQARFGLSEFKVVLDNTTTTPDLIDRNILYAKIFLKPTRAIEYIAIDFNISRTGASFVD